MSEQAIIKILQRIFNVILAFALIANPFVYLGIGQITKTTKQITAQGTQPLINNPQDKLSMNIYTNASEGHHVCIVTVTWGLKCWGQNNWNQIGTGNQVTPQFVPYQPYSLTSGIQTITSGAGHSCILKTDGSVACWGYNSVCQIGNNPASCGGWVATLTQVTGLGPGTVKQLTTGYDHNCAILADDSLACWGYNLYGQIGDGTYPTDRKVPTAVTGFGPGQDAVKAVVAGAWHTCAIKSSDDTMWCWGYNAWGQIGDNTAGTNRLNPVQVVNLSTGVEAMAANYQNTCALLVDGSVRCWGYNAGAIGQVGDGTTGSNRLQPVQVVGLTAGTTKAIAYGWNHGCALLVGGTLKCWGFGSDGQLFQGTTGSSASPVTSVGISNIVGVSAGTYATCVLTNAGVIQCVGDNIYGQIGNGLNSGHALAPYTVLTDAWVDDTTQPVLSASNS